MYKLLTLEQLPKNWEEYQQIFDERCFIQENGDTVLNPEVHQQSEKMLSRWLGFQAYMEEFTKYNLYGDLVWKDIDQVLSEADSREKAAVDVIDIASKHVGWACVQVNYMLSYLEYLKQKEGWARTLERIARLDGHYDGMIGYFMELDENPVLAFHDQHPALFDFTQVYFYYALTDPLQDDERHQLFLETLERGDAAERKEKLIGVWLSQAESMVQGGMYTLVGFLSWFEYHKLWT